MGLLHAADLEAVKKQYEAVVDGLKEEVAELRKILEVKEKQIAQGLKEYEKNTDNLN